MEARLATALEKLVKKIAPSFTPTVKWGQGCFVLDGVPKIFIHAEPEHLQFGFFAGAKLKDPDGRLQGQGKHVRHIKIFTAKDAASALLTPFITQVL